MKKSFVKRILTAALALTMSMGVFAGCDNGGTASEDPLRLLPENPLRMKARRGKIPLRLL